MAVREIAARFEIVCDGCGATETQDTTRRPAHWCDFHLLRDLYDFQGAACADGSVKRLLCAECANVAAKAINEATTARREARAHTGPAS